MIDDNSVALIRDLQRLETDFGLAEVRASQASDISWTMYAQVDDISVTFYCPDRPKDELLNRHVSFCDVGPRRLEKALGLLRQVHVRPHFDLIVGLACPLELAWLKDLRFEPVGRETVFLADIESGFASADSDLLVETVDNDKLARACVAVRSAYRDLSESEFEAWMDYAKLLNKEADATDFVIREDGKPIAAAQFSVWGDYGYFADALTLKDHRRKGCHRALMYARLEAARNAGVNSIVSIAESGSQSARNMMKFGLKPVFEIERWSDPVWDA